MSFSTPTPVINSLSIGEIGKHQPPVGTHLGWVRDFSRVQKPDWLVGSNQTVGKAGFMLSGC
jgi:hypothetical protein